MNTGSRDEQQFLANVDKAARQLGRIADSLEGIEEKLDLIDSRLVDIEAHGTALDDSLRDVRRAVEKYGN